MRYSAESTVLPTTAHDLLAWAASHVEARGYHHGRDGDRFAHDGATTTTALLRPGILGALDVAGGEGRRSSSRTYDYGALYAAHRLALDTVSDLAAGGSIAHDADWMDVYRQRRCLLHAWGMQDGRTGADVVALLREAAALAERAAADAIRPGRPPHRLLRPSAGDVLAWAAAHIIAAGHRPGDLMHAPDGFVGTAPCTTLYALERALAAAKPNPGDSPAEWEAYRAAAADAPALLAQLVTGVPVGPGAGESVRDVAKRQRAAVLAWGNAPGRSAAEVVSVFLAAAYADDAAKTDVPAEPGQVAFF